MDVGQQIRRSLITSELPALMIVICQLSKVKTILRAGPGAGNYTPRGCHRVPQLGRFETLPAAACSTALTASPRVSTSMTSMPSGT